MSELFYSGQESIPVTLFYFGACDPHCLLVKTVLLSDSCCVVSRLQSSFPNRKSDANKGPRTPTVIISFQYHPSPPQFRTSGGTRHRAPGSEYPFESLLMILLLDRRPQK